MESLWIKKIKTITKLDPFYMDIFEKLEVSISSKVRTACIIENKLLLNPYFVSKLSNKNVNEMILYEINYIIWRHNHD